MIVHGVFYTKSDADRQLMSSKKDGRGLITYQGCVEIKRNRFGWYVISTVEPLLKHVKKFGVIKIDNCVQKENLMEKYEKSSI